MPVCARSNLATKASAPPAFVWPGKEFSLHDSCKARYDVGVQESVRTIAKELGYHIEEIKNSNYFGHKINFQINLLPWVVHHYLLLYGLRISLIFSLHYYDVPVKYPKFWRHGIVFTCGPICRVD